MDSVRSTGTCRHSYHVCFGLLSFPFLAHTHFVDFAEVYTAAFIESEIGKNHAGGIGQANIHVGFGALPVAAVVEETFELDVDRIARLFGRGDAFV